MLVSMSSMASRTVMLDSDCMLTSRMGEKHILLLQLFFLLKDEIKYGTI